MVTTIYLIRHGESEGNANEFFQGNLDTMLTPKGMQQLDALADRFKDIPLDAIYFSPFQRTRITAEAVNRYHQLDMQPEYDLRELNGGEWEGRRIVELAPEYPVEFRTWCEHMAAFCAPNGDAMEDVYLRMQQVMTQIARENAGKTIAVFSHGCAVRNFICYVESGDIEALGEVGWSDNTAVSCVEYDSETETWSLRFKNDSSHLPAALRSEGAAKWNRLAPKEAKA